MAVQDRLRTIRDDLRHVLKPVKKQSQGQALDHRKETKNTRGERKDYHSPDCILFNLPREIRDRIWEHVLGGRLIHIGNPSARKITHVLCRAPISNLQAHAMYPFSDSDKELWDTLPKSLPPGQDYIDDSVKDSRNRYHNFRHSTCFSNSWRLARVARPHDPPDHSVQKAIREEQVSLTVLRTCRAVYAEASRVLWAGNSFAFGKSTTFLSFAGTRAPVQRDLLRHLALKTEQTISILTAAELAKSTHKQIRGSPWSRALKLLPNLASVYLTARYDLTWEVVRAMWCHGELITPVGAGNEIEIIDDLAEKPRLAEVCLHVEGIEVGSLYFEQSLRMHACDELQEDLQELLQRRMRWRRSAARGDREHGMQVALDAFAKLELDDAELERRQASWEVYLQDRGHLL